MRRRAREDLEHDEERHHARVGLREVAKVVVRRDLSRERRVLLPHPLLDERVTDAVHERRPARLLDRLGDGPARPYVVDHLRAGILLEHGGRKEGGGEVPGDELARVVDEEAAVGITVEGDSEVRALGAGLLDDELAVLGEERVRLVVGKGPVRLEEAADDVELRDALEDGRQHHRGHAVRGVDHDPQRADLGDVDEGQHLVHEPEPDVLLADRAALLDGAEAGLRAGADLLEAGVASDRERAAAHDLHPRVAARVVRRGDADPAVERELADREVDHLRAHEPEVENVGAAVRRALDRRGSHGRRRDAHVATDRDRARLEVLDVRPPDAVGAVLVQLARVQPADVVGLEDTRVEHSADARPLPRG